MSKPQLLDMLPEQLTALAVECGEKPFRAKQLFGWLHKGEPLSGMRNLPKRFLEQLERSCTLGLPRILEKKQSQKDDTVKYLFALEDGNVIESVKMAYHHGNTLCISSQVGCNMGCAFCASTQDGCVRDLTAGEMVGQILAATRDDEREYAGRAITNVVVMGSGEPLLNVQRTIKFLQLASHPQGLGMAMRNISISTCGIPPAMRQLSDTGRQVTLCVSLHAPNDEVRGRIMPIARQYTMQEVLGAARYHIEKTGRRVIFEYILIHGVNDAPEQARELAARLHGMQCHVNLIPLNPVEECDLLPPSPAQAAAFEAALSQAGISCTRRRTLGEDIDGACGQLRRRHLTNGEKRL